MDYLKEKAVSAKVATLTDSSALTTVNVQQTSTGVAAAASSGTILQQHIEENQQ